MGRAIGRLRDLLRFAVVESNAKEFDGLACLCGVENRLAVSGPNRRVATAAVKVMDVEKLGHTAITAAVGELFQACPIGAHDVRMTVVMFPPRGREPSGRQATRSVQS